MGTVEPQARCGSSAFGPIAVRAVAADGAAGDWLPLGTLVRMPTFRELHCPRAVAKPCTLTGSNLFLATAIGSGPDLNNATDVPADFAGTQLNVAHPVNGTLYLRLRDDPATVQTLTLPMAVPPPSPAALQPAAVPAASPAAQPEDTKPVADPHAAPTAPATAPNK
jgi:hypothetical protein